MVPDQAQCQKKNSPSWIKPLHFDYQLLRSRQESYKFVEEEEELGQNIMEQTNGFRKFREQSCGVYVLRSSLTLHSITDLYVLLATRRSLATAHPTHPSVTWQLYRSLRLFPLTSSIVGQQTVDLHLALLPILTHCSSMVGPY